MALIQNVSLAFRLVATTNEAFLLGMLNLEWWWRW